MHKAHLRINFDEKMVTIAYDPQDQFVTVHETVIEIQNRPHVTEIVFDFPNVGGFPDAAPAVSGK